MAFPEYTPPEKGKSTGFFNASTETKNQHRKYKDGGYINLPSTLIDTRILKDLSRQAIFALIWLYNNINWLDYWGVDFYLIRKECPYKGFQSRGRFSQGFHQSIYQKNYLEATDPLKWDLCKKEINFNQGNLADAVEELINASLFELKPILVQKDKDEPDILRLKQEIFKGLVRFKNDSNCKNKYYFCLQKEINHIIIWVLMPKDSYIVKTPDYEIYLKNREQSHAKQKELYSYDDFRTRISKHLELINTEEFWDWLVKAYNETYEKVLPKFGKTRPESIYSQNKLFTDEFLKESILPNIPIGQIMHYNNYVNYKES